MNDLSDYDDAAVPTHAANATASGRENGSEGSKVSNNVQKCPVASLRPATVPASFGSQLATAAAVPGVSRPSGQPADTSEIEVWSTEGDERLLHKVEPLQLRVITCLVNGEPVTQTSRVTGVGRSTIYYWLNHDFHFRAELDAQRREMYEVVASGLIAVAEEALEQVIEHMEKGSLQAALALLKGIGLLNGRRPDFNRSLLP